MMLTITDQSQYLPTLSKIIEKWIQKHLMSFLKNHNLLHEKQSGFREGHSTESALILMIDSWLKAINDGKFVGGLMVDFRKAFDLVDHNLLLQKLKLYKCDENSLLCSIYIYLTGPKGCQ